eukprot:SAG31_NODE_31728_length_365_cov_0.571429_1_plen_71_part_10
MLLHAGRRVGLESADRAPPVRSLDWDRRTEQIQALMTTLHAVKDNSAGASSSRIAPAQASDEYNGAFAEEL